MERKRSYYENRKEKIDNLYCDSFGGRRGICIFDKKWYEAVYECKATAALSTDVAFPDCMDNSVPHYGNNFIYGACLRRGTGKNRRHVKTIWNASCSELFLVNYFF